MIVHRAPLVLPIQGPNIMDGAVAVANEIIVDVGPATRLLKDAASVVDHEGCLLMPGLINGHAHLELSAFATLGRQPETTGNMVAWIKKLMAMRLAAAEQQETQTVAAAKTLAAMRAEGIALIVDIGNESSLLPEIPGPGPQICFLREILGLSQTRVTAAQKLLSTISGPVTAHGPHSTAPTLLRTIKERAKKQKSIFSLHMAESPAEIEFLATGQGPFRDFLTEIGGWDNSYTPPGCGAGHYLERLGLLDAQTLCVHAVHLEAAEINILAQRRAGVCLCPGSNQFLGVGKAPLGKLLAAGIVPALGTDSAASNPELSIWREMRLLAADHPDVSPQIIVSMATMAGARAVGQDDFYGSLAPGQSGHFLAVPCADLQHPYDFLTHDSIPKEVRWL